MGIPASNSFAFQARELPRKLSQVSEETLSGSWFFEFLILDRNRRVEPLYIRLSNGRVVFSGQQISWETLVKTLQRYISRLRGDTVQQKMLAVSQQLNSRLQDVPTTRLFELLEQCYRLNLISPQEVVEALRLKILSDFDTYLFEYSGQAQFLPSFPLGDQAPNIGFDLQELLSEAEQRQFWWNKLQAQIPSMSCIPVLNQPAVQCSNLSPEQKQRLEMLASHGKTLEEIAFAFAQDSLEIAKFFAKLVSEGLVTLAPSPNSQGFLAPASQESDFGSAVPTIFVVDDSPLLLQQFQNLVTRWGYQVNTSTQPETVIETMLRIKPEVVFLDINMPRISGFDLVKQIRRCPEFATIPLIILTAEKTLNNNWRARWSGCQFLTKPLTSSEVSQFQKELRLLLAELVPLPSSHPLKYPTYQNESPYQLRKNSV